MNGAKLTESVAFDAPVSQSDAYGGAVDGWSQTYACPAHFKWLRGGEGVLASRLEGRQPVIVTIRKSDLADQITSGHRMRDLRTGTIYNVRTNAPMQDNRGWRELLCESGVA